MLSPDYPGAGMLLLTINRILSNDVLKASSTATKHNSNVESTYLSTAFDVLGKITSASARVLAASREKPLKISKSGKENKAVDRNAEANNCYCRRTTLVETFMVNCDECHEWFHGECVGMTKETVSHVWFCDDCRLKQMVVEETKAFAERSRRHHFDDISDDHSPCVSDTHIFRQLLLNHLSQQAGTSSSSPASQSARQVHLAKWIEELHEGQPAASTDESTGNASFVSRLLCDHFLEQWDGSPTAQRETAGGDHAVGSSSRRCLNKEGNLRLMLNLTAKSDLVLSFPRQLGLLIRLMADEAHVSLRKLSVKAISQVSSHQIQCSAASTMA